MRVRQVSLDHFAGPTAASGMFDISGDFVADVARAVEEDHPCEDDACDIAAAMQAECPLSAATLLYGATECPALDAVRFAYSLRADGIPHDFGREMLSDSPDWETWHAYHVEHGVECEGCGSFTYGTDSYIPEQCGNCLAEFPQVEEEE